MKLEMMFAFQFLISCNEMWMAIDSGFVSIESVCNSIVLILKRRDESRGDGSGK